MRPKIKERPPRIPQTCRYCEAPVIFIQNNLVHKGGHQGMIYLCTNDACGASVGTHKKSGVAFGSLANSLLRKARFDAHKCFDRLWLKKRCFACRDDAYDWLAERMEANRDMCHIAYFEIVHCQQVIEICNERYAEYLAEKDEKTKHKQKK